MWLQIIICDTQVQDQFRGRIHKPLLFMPTLVKMTIICNWIPTINHLSVVKKVSIDFENKNLSESKQITVPHTDQIHLHITTAGCSNSKLP